MITALVVAIILWLSAFLVVIAAGATPSIGVERALSSTEPIIRPQAVPEAQQGIAHAA